jgi:hypothetical protein
MCDGCNLRLLLLCAGHQEDGTPKKGDELHLASQQLYGMVMVSFSAPEWIHSSLLLDIS